MKIERIEIHPLVGKLDQPFGWSQRWTNERATQVIKIIADNWSLRLGRDRRRPRRAGRCSDAT